MPPPASRKIICVSCGCSAFMPGMGGARSMPKPCMRRQLAALLPDASEEGDEGMVRAVAERLKLSGADRARLEDLSAAREKIVSHLSLRDVRKLLYRVGAGPFRDRVRLRWAASPKGAAVLQW